MSPKQFDAGIALANVDEAARHQSIAFEDLSIVLHTDFVVGTAFEIIEDDLGQAPLGEDAVVFDVDGFRGHGELLSEALSEGSNLDQGWDLRAKRSCQRLLEVVGRGGAHALHAVALGEGDEVDTREVKRGHTFDFQHLRKPAQRTVGAVLQDQENHRDLVACGSPQGGDAVVGRPIADDCDNASRRLGELDAERRRHGKAKPASRSEVVTALFLHRQSAPQEVGRRGRLVQVEGVTGRRR
jgi:hypothetical protein